MLSNTTDKNTPLARWIACADARLLAIKYWRARAEVAEQATAKCNELGETWERRARMFREAGQPGTAKFFADAATELAAATRGERRNGGQA